MSLRLSSAEITAIERATSVLLAPSGVPFLPADADVARRKENEFFQRLMCSDPDRSRVRNEVLRAVHGLASRSSCNGHGPRVPQAKSEFRTAAGCYRIVTTRLDQTLNGESGYVVALVERVESQHVDAKAIASRFSDSAFACLVSW